MKKYGLLLGLCVWCLPLGYAAGSCPQFDENMQVVYTDCQTGKILSGARPLHARQPLVNQHDVLLSLYGGYGVYIKGHSDVDVWWQQDNVDVRNMQFASMGISGMFFVTSYFGLGLGLEKEVFVHSDNVREDYSAYWSHLDSEISLDKIMLLGRFNFDETSSTRVYLPFGVGYARVRENQIGDRGDRYGYEQHTVRKKYQSTPVFFIGLGVELDLNKTFSLGFEGRYNWYSYQQKAFSYANALIKLNMKL